MPTSTQLTEMILRSPNPKAAMHKLWDRTRYLVAQRPATEKDTTTKEGYYNGRVVVPGPLADPTISAVLTNTDLDIVMNQFFIRFVDNSVSAGAEESVVQALYTIMSDAEANEYEAQLRKLAGKTKKPSEPERIHSETT